MPTPIDPDNRHDPEFDRLFNDEQSFKIAAGDPVLMVNGRPMPVDCRIVADATYRKIIAHSARLQTALERGQQIVNQPPERRKDHAILLSDIVALEIILEQVG